MNEESKQVRWGTITAIAVSEIPPQTTGKYLGLFQDVSLRLENTSPLEALRVPIDDPRALTAARAALRKMFRGQQVEVLKRAGALFIYNTVVPRGRGRHVVKDAAPAGSVAVRANGKRDPFHALDDAGYEEEVA